MLNKHLSAILVILSGALGACGASDENLGVTTEALSPAFVGNLGFPATHSYVTSRSAHKWDAFMVNGGTLTYRRYDNGWQAAVDLSKPAGVGSLKRVTAIPTKTTTGLRLDVFATASDNKIYHRFQTNPGAVAPAFSAWAADLPGNPTVDGNGALAGTSWDNGRIDLFWWTQSAAGHLGHAWADGLVWQGVESGDTASATYLQASPPNTHNKESLSVASWAPGRLDIFFGGSQVHHHWFANSWGTVANPNRESGLLDLTNAQAGFIQSSGNVAVRAAGLGSLELYFTATPGFTKNLYTTTNFTFTNGLLNVQQVNLGPLGSASNINSITRMSSPTRVDVFGPTGSDVWQAYLN